MPRSNGTLVKLDIFFKSLLHSEFISAKGFELILAQVRTRLLIYVFRPVNYNSLRIIDSASIVRISKESICMTNMGPKGDGPNMPLNFDQKDDIRTVLR